MLSVDFDKDSSQTIRFLRGEIDLLDQTLMQLLLERFELSQKIQKLKADLGQPITCLERENQIRESLKRQFPEIPEPAIDQIYTAIFRWAKSQTT